MYSESLRGVKFKFKSSCKVPIELLRLRNFCNEEGNIAAEHFFVGNGTYCIYLLGMAVRRISNYECNHAKDNIDSCCVLYEFARNNT